MLSDCMQRCLAEHKDWHDRSLFELGSGQSTSAWRVSWHASRFHLALENRWISVTGKRLFEIRGIPEYRQTDYIAIETSTWTIEGLYAVK